MKLLYFGTLEWGSTSLQRMRALAEIVNAVVESKVKAILVHRGDDPVITTNAKRLGITVCRTLAESLAYLERVSETRVHPPLLRRVARHAGLR